jgi:hypothetical protein
MLNRGPTFLHFTSEAHRQREEIGAGTGLIDQQHLVVAGDRYRDRGQDRSGIGDQVVAPLLIRASRI